MHYTKEMIAAMGYESAEAFVEDFVKKHGNCCFRFTYDGGVYAVYDMDTSLGLDNQGCCVYEEEA